MLRYSVFKVMKAYSRCSLWFFEFFGIIAPVIRSSLNRFANF
jgi:hypothetical protein